MLSTFKSNLYHLLMSLKYYKSYFVTRHAFPAAKKSAKKVQRGFYSLN